MKRFVTIVLCLFSFLLAGCRQHDWRELVIKVPEMQTEAAARLVERAIRQIETPNQRLEIIRSGTLDVNYENRTATLIYDSLLAADMNFIHLVAMAGFDANDIPGDAEARAAWPDTILP